MRTLFMERRGKIEDLDFWQKQSPQARFDAAWEMIVHAWLVKGKDVRQLRLHRTVETFQRQQG